MSIRKFYMILLIFSLNSSVEAKTLCEGLSLELTEIQHKNWSESIAKQLNTSSVDILFILGSGQWRIVYVDTHQADQAFLFYSNDPTDNRYINLWSGAARHSETSVIKKWALKNIPNIPKKLASCFAWYVTKGERSSL